MAFWSHDFSAEARDPKRKFRFTVNFNGFLKDGGFVWYAKTADKPTFTLATTEHNYLNHKFYYPGTVTWNEVSITMVDPTDPHAAAALSQILMNSGYKLPANANADQRFTINKHKAVNALKQVTVSHIDAEGKELETWTLWNAFITEVNYGSLEYGSDDLSELTVKLKYDWARLVIDSSAGLNDYVKNTAGNDANEFFGVEGE